MYRSCVHVNLLRILKPLYIGNRLVLRQCLFVRLLSLLLKLFMCLHCRPLTAGCDSSCSDGFVIPWLGPTTALPPQPGTVASPAQALTGAASRPLPSASKGRVPQNPYLKAWGSEYNKNWSSGDQKLVLKIQNLVKNVFKL